jgi:predicted nucleic acid-binding Zn ribbon protein
MRERERRRRLRATTRAGSAIAALLDGHAIAEPLRRLRIVTEWEALVGNRIAARAQPDDLGDDGVLWVRVSNSAWMHELSFHRDALLARLNEALGAPALVRDVRFHLGRGRRDREAPANTTAGPRRPPRPARRPLPPPAAGERLRAIAGETATVEDDELRAIILEARRRLDL